MLSFMLMLAGSYVSSLQNWLVFSKSNENRIVNQIVSHGSIRSISSSQAPVKTYGFGHLEDILPSDSSVPVATSVVPENVNILSSTPLTRPGHTEILLNPKSSEPLPFPAFIEYTDELILEFPEALASKVNLKRAISKVLLSVSEVNETDLLSLDPIRSQNKPFYYKKVKNQYGRAIRYPADANSYAEYLLKKHTSEVVDSGLKFTVVHIPLVENKLPINVEKYRSWVEDYAARFKVSPALVFAIMETESDFKPEAVSRSNAMGLMQLKASTAGKDVFQYVDFRQGEPSRSELFDEKENIRMGTAYLGLLNHDYFAQVRNEHNKEMLTIASYNGGLSTVLKLFGDSSEKALEQINRLHPRQVYRKLRFEHQSKETREYLDKVLKAKTKYQDILNT